MTYTDTDTGEATLDLPGWDERDPAQLEAWFGAFGHAEHFRKVLLASAREAARAKSLLNREAPGWKAPSEARLDDIARTSDRYVQFLVDSLNGRVLRERNVIASNAR